MGVTLTGVLNLKPEDERRLHPVVLKCLKEHGAMVEKEVALYGLTPEDLNTLILDDELTELARYKHKIRRSLGTCIDLDAGSDDAPVDAAVGFSFILLQLDLFSIVEHVKSLLKKVCARKAAHEFNVYLNQQIAQLTSQLEKRPRDLSSYFKDKVRHKRFNGRSLESLLRADEKYDFDDNLVRVANKKLQQLIPQDLCRFINFPSVYYRLYFPMPTAGYSFEGVPCIDFSFEVFVAAYAEIWLKPVKKSFGGYEFTLPLVKEKDGLAPLKEPKFLGYYYLILSPDDLDGYVFWQIIPLVLLKGLLSGETRPSGATVMSASDDEVTYEVEGFEKAVEIPAEFADYLKAIGSIERMVRVGIISAKIADIVRAEFVKIEGQQGALSREVTPPAKHTRKARAFELFGCGKRPSDPEVKALELKPSTVYRYYQSWKKIGKHA
jgi:hypothetical protein